MEFEDNFSELLLIAEKPVTFYIDRQSITMRLIKIGDAYTDLLIQRALAILHMPLDDIRQHIKNVTFDSIWALLRFFTINGEHNYIIDSIQALFNYSFDNFSIDKNIWKINDIILDEELFNRITEIWLITNGIKKFSEQNKFQIDKPKWLIEQEEKIRRIKSQGKQVVGGGAGNEVYQSVVKLFIPLNYEFGYTFEQLFNMNYFHIQALHGYISKVVSYDIQKRSVAVGLSKKKLKYVTD